MRIILNLCILKGLIATAITTAPTVIPAATLTLGGVNYFNNVNQQNVLDEQQSSLDSLSTRLSSAESSISSSSSATGIIWKIYNRFITLQSGQAKKSCKLLTFYSCV